MSVSIYLCIIYPAFVAPWFLRSVYTLKCSVYWSAHMHDLQLYALEWTARTTGATRVCREDYWRGQVGEFADTWYKQIQSPETVELLAIAARQFANVPMWIRNNRWLTVLLFCDVHIGIGTTLSLLQCLHVICGCTCRPVQTNSAETSLALLHM